MYEGHDTVEQDVKDRLDMPASPDVPASAAVEPYEAKPNDEIPILQEDGAVESLDRVQEELEASDKPQDAVETYEAKPNDEIPILQEDGAVEEDSAPRQDILNGNDDPATTDYFADSQEAADVLMDFAPDNWEALTIAEQKEAIEQLTDLNADILGSSRPSIEYYDKDDPGDFGGYREETNTIYVNERNMGDGPEVADTIAHECRHSYQRIRASEPQCERDAMFGDSFDNYINPEDDRRGYLGQLVESDARQYAERFSEFIRDL